jgi:hypothetical protein
VNLGAVGGRAFPQPLKSDTWIAFAGSRIAERESQVATLALRLLNALADSDLAADEIFMLQTITLAAAHFQAKHCR